LLQIKLNPALNGLAYHQAIVRLLTKLEFVTAIACGGAEAIGADTYLHVQEKNRRTANPSRDDQSSIDCFRKGREARSISNVHSKFQLY
jgi:uncharacterized protein YktB (UPF0637 family)